MSGDGMYAMVYACCCICGHGISFNPHRVPSTRINGVREPLCRHCAIRINENRVATGLEPVAIDEDAYKPIPAGDL